MDCIIPYRPPASSKSSISAPFIHSPSIHLPSTQVPYTSFPPQLLPLQHALPPRPPPKVPMTIGGLVGRSGASVVSVDRSSSNRNTAIPERELPLAMTIPSLGNRSLCSQNPKTTPADAVSRQPPEATIPNKRDEMMAVHGGAQSSSSTTTATSVQVEPSSSHPGKLTDHEICLEVRPWE